MRLMRSSDLIGSVCMNVKTHLLFSRHDNYQKCGNGFRAVESNVGAFRLALMPTFNNDLLQEEPGGDVLM